MTVKWKQVFLNEVLKPEGEDFFVSYNMDTRILGKMWAGDGNGEETALVIDGEFYVLNGDFRKDYERLVPEGRAACKRFYDEHSAQKSSWSEGCSEFFEESQE